MEKQVSTKNTKNEILKAYDELLQKIQEKKVSDTKSRAEEQQKQKTVEKANNNSYDGIVKDIAGLKVNINASLDKLEDSLLKEFKNLTDINEAIETESGKLQQLYQITVNADSLEALILAQKEKKAEFENEMEEKRDSFEQEMKLKREAWEKEKQTIEQDIKELKEATAKNRKREEEEYAYNLNQKRKKEEDAYVEKRDQQEKVLAEKLKEWEQKETEYTELKAKVDAFPKQMEDAVKNTRDEISKELTAKHKFEKDLFEKGIEGDIKLYKQTIANLESKIKEQNLLIEQLTKKADLSSDQVKEIALKAVEGAASQRLAAEREKKDRNRED